MTEKQYGGATGRSTGKTTHQVKTEIINKKIIKEGNKVSEKEESANSDTENKKNYIEAGKIASEVVKYAKSIIKPNMPLLEMADKIESKIMELGGKPAFPINLSINEVAAHDTPSYNDTRVAHG